jgi:hypothetical protein
MGTYATTTSLATLMIGTDFSNTATVNLATKCITHAENEINKYLSRRYDLSSSYFQTSTAVPPLVTTWCEQLAMGYMYRQLSRGGKDGLDRGKELINGVILNLKDVAEFKMHVSDSTGAILPEATNTSAYRVLSNTETYSNTFNEDDELLWSVDSDKLDDIDSERS